MQKDFMAMAQGQAAPAQQQQLTPEEQQAMQEFEPMNDEDFQAMGMTPGNDPQAIKARVVELLERLGLMDEVSASEKMEIFQQVDQFVQDLISGNMEAASQNPVSQMLEGASGQFEELDAAEMELENV
jgi:hypothetical protein